MVGVICIFDGLTAIEMMLLMDLKENNQYNNNAIYFQMSITIDMI